MSDWEKFSRGFLTEWLKTLLTSMEKHLDEETRLKIFRETGGFCARVHTTEIFKKLKETTNDLEEFLVAINKEFTGASWEKIDDKTLKVIYKQCFCPFICKGVHKLPVQCDCSVGWIKENLEMVFEKPIKVTLVDSILRGGFECEFKVEL
ncbi:MAG: DUF6144 family protein [Candidatus Heimdallarchaeota archaeon]